MICSANTDHKLLKYGMRMSIAIKTPDEEEITKLCRFISNSKKLVVITGAGVCK